jgi:hypothetical protein
MNVSPTEAREALAAIQEMERKTRHSLSGDISYVTLIITGIVWMIGFTCSQFLPQEIIGYIWVTLSIVGTAVGNIIGLHRGKRIQSPLTIPTAKRIGIFWLLLVLLCVTTLFIAEPIDGKQATIHIILFILFGHTSMGMIVSFSETWWPLPIAVLSIIGYYLVPDIFYLWIAILGGGGMIALGLQIRAKW